MLNIIFERAQEHMRGACLSDEACAIALQRALETYDWPSLLRELEDGDITVEAIVLGIAEDARDIERELEAKRRAESDAAPYETAWELARAISKRLRGFWRPSSRSASQYIMASDYIALVRISDHQRAAWTREGMPEPLVEVAVGQRWAGAQFDIEPGAPAEQIEALASKIVDALPPQHRKSA